MMIPEDYQAYYVLAVVISLFVVLFKEYLKPAVSFLLAIMLLVLPGVITPKDVLDGFSNQSIASIVLLILITAGMRSNFNMENFLDKAFGKPKKYRHFLVTMMAKVAVLSSFVNNTPVVVMMTPYVFEWGKRNKISPSKLLIPLSYATIVGGMITIIGTSTTLVLNGFLINEKLSQINSTSLLVIGLSVVAVSLLFLTLFSNKLLPNRIDLIESFAANQREYLIEKRLSDNSPLVGKTVKEGGLRNLEGVYLVEIVRGEKLISPVKPEQVIESGDVLIFAGNTNKIVDLTVSNIGVELPTKINQSYADKVKVVEAVVSANSSLLGKSIKLSNFRERYDAAVVAIHRNGEKLSGKIGRIKLKAGDVLLMYVGSEFDDRVDLYKDMYVISGETRVLKNANNNNRNKLIILGASALLLLATSWFSLFISLLILFAEMVFMRLITVRNIKRDLDINMIVILVLSLALGEAMIKTGAGGLIVTHTMSILADQRPVVIIAGLMLVTTILTSFITNVGAVAISFPIALAICEEMHLTPEPVFLALAFAASAAFLTPIGYQTNLIVYGPGGYSFKDFFKIGLPTTLIYLSTALFVIFELYSDQL